MSEGFEHNGIRYWVDVTELGRGQWRWTYRIEDGRTGKIGDRPLPSEELALEEAKCEAEFRIGDK